MISCSANTFCLMSLVHPEWQLTQDIVVHSLSSFQKINKQTKTDTLANSFYIILQNSQQRTKEIHKWNTWIAERADFQEVWRDRVWERWGTQNSQGHLLHCSETICFWTLPSLRRPQERTHVGLLASVHTTLSEAYKTIMPVCSIREVLTNQSP